MDNEERDDLAAIAEDASLAGRRFELLFQGLPVPCLGFDLSGTIFEWNRACEQSLGHAPALLFMSSLRNFFVQSDEDEDRIDEILDQVAKGVTIEGAPWVLTVSGRASRHILVNAIPRLAHDGQIHGGLLAWTDVTALKEYEQQIEQQLAQINEYSAQIEIRTRQLEEANTLLSTLASTDGLTGLSNHRAFHEALRIEVGNSKPGHLSIALLDVDQFKLYNDTYGHPQGDVVLKGIATCMRKGSRREDVVARYGGEEFVVLLPSAGRDNAIRVAERIRKLISEFPFANGPVTASFGVATLGPQGMDAEELIYWADLALYRSKHDGRNRVTHADCLDALAA